MAYNEEGAVREEQGKEEYNGHVGHENRYGGGENAYLGKSSQYGNDDDK